MIGHLLWHLLLWDVGHLVRCYGSWDAMPMDEAGSGDTESLLASSGVALLQGILQVMLTGAIPLTLSRPLQVLMTSLGRPIGKPYWMEQRCGKDWGLKISKPPGLHDHFCQAS